MIIPITQLPNIQIPAMNFLQKIVGPNASAGLLQCINAVGISLRKTLRQSMQFAKYFLSIYPQLEKLKKNMKKFPNWEIQSEMAYPGKLHGR